MKKNILIILLSLVSLGFSGGQVATEENNVLGIEAKAKGTIVRPSEFNTVVKTIRGIFNYYSSGSYSFGLNKAPTANVTLDLDGSLQLGNLYSASCNTLRAGVIYFNTAEKDFLYCNGSVWRRLNMPS